MKLCATVCVCGHPGLPELSIDRLRWDSRSDVAGLDPDGIGSGPVPGWKKISATKH